MYIYIRLLTVERNDRSGLQYFNLKLITQHTLLTPITRVNYPKTKSPTTLSATVASLAQVIHLISKTADIRRTQTCNNRFKIDF